MDSNDASGKRFVPPKLSKSWLLPPPQQQTCFHQTNTPGKQKWGRSVAHLDGQCHFIQAAETRRYRFKDDYLGWSNAKWLLRLYQRTLEGSDRAFLVTPWKGGVGGLDMFFHPPLDHYKLYLNDINWPFSQEWTDFEAAGGATRLSDGHFSNHWGITPFPGGQWNNPSWLWLRRTSWQAPFFGWSADLMKRVFWKSAFFQGVTDQSDCFIWRRTGVCPHFFFGEGPLVPWCHQFFFIRDGFFSVSLRSFFFADAPIFSRYVRQSPHPPCVLSTESLVSVSCFQRLTHSWWELHFKIHIELC